MTALSPAQMQAMRQILDADAITDSWKAIHASAAEVAALAGLAPEKSEGAITDFPAHCTEAGEWQRSMARQGIDDIEAMLRPGLIALRTIAARGGDTTAAALALWREFYSARGAILAFVEPFEAAEAA